MGVSPCCRCCDHGLNQHHIAIVFDERGADEGVRPYTSYFWSSSRTVSSVTVPTMAKLLGLSLSMVSCVLCQKTLL